MYLMRIFYIPFQLQSPTGSIINDIAFSPNYYLRNYAPNIITIAPNEDLVYNSTDMERIFEKVPMYVSVFIRFHEFDHSSFLDSSLSSSKKKKLISSLVTHSSNTKSQLLEALAKEANIPINQIKSFWVSNSICLNFLLFSDQLMTILSRFRPASSWILYEFFFAPDQYSSLKSSPTIYIKYNVHLYASKPDQIKKVGLVAVGPSTSNSEIESLEQISCENNDNTNSDENQNLYSGFAEIQNYYDLAIENSLSISKGEGVTVGLLSFMPLSTSPLYRYKPPRVAASEARQIHDSGLISTSKGPGLYGRSIAPKARIIGAAAYSSGDFSILKLCDLLDDIQFLIAPNGDCSIGADVILLSSYVIASASNRSFRESFLELDIWKRIIAVLDLCGIISVMAAGSVSPDDDYIDILRSLPRVMVIGSISGITGYPSQFSARGLSSNNWNDRLLPDFMAPGEPITLSITTTNYKIVGGGTSFAAASVAFTIASMRSMAPRLTFDEIFDILSKTAIKPSTWNQVQSDNTMEHHFWANAVSFRDSNGTLSYPNVIYGYGIIDPLGAITEAARAGGSSAIMQKAYSFIDQLEKFLHYPSASSTSTSTSTASSSSTNNIPSPFLLYITLPLFGFIFL